MNSYFIKMGEDYEYITSMFKKFAVLNSQKKMFYDMLQYVKDNCIQITVCFD